MVVRRLNDLHLQSIGTHLATSGMCTVICIMMCGFIHVEVDSPMLESLHRYTPMMHSGSQYERKSWKWQHGAAGATKWQTNDVIFSRVEVRYRTKCRFLYGVLVVAATRGSRPTTCMAARCFCAVSGGRDCPAYGGGPL